MGRGSTRLGRMTLDATLTSKGQLTVPLAVRDALHVGPGDRLRFAPDEKPGTFRVTSVPKGDLLSLAGIFAEAGARVGDIGIQELRRRAAVGRAKRMERASEK